MLAEQNFAQDRSFTLETLADLNRTISSLRNDDLLRMLRNSGQGSAFGALRNHLTQLKFISQMAGKSDVVFTPQMQTDLRAARRIVDAACVNISQQQVDVAAATAGTGDEDQTNPAERTEYSGIYAGLRKVMTDEQIAYLERTFRLHLLGKLFGGVLLAISAAIALYYITLTIIVVRRNRRTCKVPATLTCMMMDIPGHLTVVGRVGCTFTLSDSAQDVSVGSYCTLTAGGIALHGKTITNTEDVCAVVFTQPLSRSTLANVLTTSQTPVRYDFGAMNARGKYALGLSRSRLPRVAR